MVAELAAYDEYLDAIRVEKTVRADFYDEGREEGEQIGMAKGREEEKEKIALKFLGTGMTESIVDQKNIQEAAC